MNEAVPFISFYAGCCWGGPLKNKIVGGQAWVGFWGARARSFRAPGRAGTSQGGCLMMQPVYGFSMSFAHLVCGAPCFPA